MKYQGQKIASSFYLPKSPFLRGIARLIDFRGALNRDMLEQMLEQDDAEPAKSKADAIRSTWAAVGENMRWAINQYEKEMNEKNTS